MDKFIQLMPAAVTAAGIRAKAIALERDIDSARRGADIDPWVGMEALMREVNALAKQLPKRERPRAAA